jgi:hypothetical protein
LSCPWSLENFQLKVVSFFLFHFFSFWVWVSQKSRTRSQPGKRERERGWGARGRVFLLLNEPRNDGRIGIFLEGFGELVFCVGSKEAS